MSERGKVSKVFLILFNTLYVIANLFNHSPLKEVGSYQVYYGSKVENYVEAFGRFDLLILEPAYYNHEDLEALKDKTESFYFGYVSIFEVPSWDEAYVKKMSDDYYLTVNGSMVSNTKYGNNVGDIRNESYRKVLLLHIKENIVDKGFDGVFLDTVDWIDYYYEDSALMKSLIAGYQQFLSEFHDLFPEILLIQNRSFRSYDMSAHHVNGIMWEDFSYEDVLDEKRQQTMMLIKHQLFHNQTVLAVSHEDAEQNKAWADKLHWLFLDSHQTYDELGED